MKSNQEPEYITFESIQKMIGVADITLFEVYLKEIYKDLASRNDSTLKKGISKSTFYDYIKIPIFLSEKLFFALDKDGDGFLSSTEFVEGLKNLYTGDFDKTLTIIFDMLDFDKDGEINKEDTKILLSYLPLKTDNSKFQYKFQMDSLTEIDQIITQTFKAKKTLKLADFKSSVETEKSDIFLQLLCFLYLEKPFNPEAVITLQASRKRCTSFKQQRKKSNPDIIKGLKEFHDSNDSNSNQTLLLTPNRKSTLSPLVSFLQSKTSSSSRVYDKSSSSITKKSAFAEENTPIISGMKGMLRLYNEKVSEQQSENLEENIKNSKNIYQSPTTYLLNKKNSNESPGVVGSTKKDGVEIEQVKIGDKLVEFEKLQLEMSDDEESEKEDEEKDDKESSESNSTRNNSNIITYENWVYKVSNQDNLKKYYLVVINKDIFYYKTDSKEELLGMHNLSGCFIKENGEKVIHKIKFFCFQIIYQSKIKNYYTTEKDVALKFLDTIKMAIGYLNFFDFYEMQGDLGEGRFGKVKLGVHKRTNQHVAIKIIKKSEMSAADGELVKSEIDIMKLCHHPNIVHLLDHFENGEYIFIVMEYLAGGDLDSYLRKQKTLFTEEKAANLMYQIASGIQYLHQYGIVHRDLKPENIMLTEANDNGKVKIMDFGLSKIMGPEEKASDGFGTINFVAPEVLLRTPYNKSIDIWSIGIILYYVLCGRLPFDDPSDNDEVIAKYTVFNEVEFPKQTWGKRSPEVIDLITKCLIKKPEKRINIEGVLNHEWFNILGKKGRNSTASDENKKERFKSKKKLEIVV